jgi:hypothetical protein
MEREYFLTGYGNPEAHDSTLVVEKNDYIHLF